MIKQGLISGAETIQRVCYRKSKTAGYNDKTNYVVHSIFINLIERARTIKILTDLRQTESVGVLVRSFIELVVSIDYILEKETDKRALSYFYHYRISMLEKIEKLGKINPEYIDLPKEAFVLLKEDFENVSTISEVLTKYKKLHDKLYDNSVNRSQKWFNLHGEKRRNFKDLMLSMGFDEDLYFVIYGFGSVDTHGAGSIGSVRQSKGAYKVEGTLPIDLSHSIVEKYLSTTVEKFAKHYGVMKKSEVVMAFKQMGTSSSGGKFNLYKSK
jgi:hypothetical protein